MSMTMTQKILAAHAGLDKVEAGELILVILTAFSATISLLPSLSASLTSSALTAYTTKTR